MISSVILIPKASDFRALFTVSAQGPRGAWEIATRREGTKPPYAPTIRCKCVTTLASVSAGKGLSVPVTTSTATARPAIGSRPLDLKHL